MEKQGNLIAENKVTIILGVICLLFSMPAWYMVKYQVHELGISPQLSVGVRMVLGGVFLSVLSKFIHKNQKNEISTKNIWLVLVMGFALYGVNFWLVYSASHYMTSGLIAVVLATMIVPNMIFGKLFLGRSISKMQVISAFLGLLGVALCFLPELQANNFDQTTFIGFALVFLGMFGSVTGTILTGKLVNFGFKAYFLTYSGMIVGGVLSIVYAMLFTANNWDSILTSGFLISILYLSLLVTTTSSLVYARLIEKFGPGPASFLWIVLPVNSLLFSSIFEQYNWTYATSIGISVIVLGGYLMSGISIWNFVSKFARKLKTKALP